MVSILPANVTRTYNDDISSICTNFSPVINNGGVEDLIHNVVDDSSLIDKVIVGSTDTYKQNSTTTIINDTQQKFDYLLNNLNTFTPNLKFEILENEDSFKVNITKSISFKYSDLLKKYANSNLISHELYAKLSLNFQDYKFKLTPNNMTSSNIKQTTSHRLYIWSKKDSICKMISFNSFDCDLKKLLIHKTRLINNKTKQEEMSISIDIPKEKKGYQTSIKKIGNYGKISKVSSNSTPSPKVKIEKLMECFDENYFLSPTFFDKKQF